MPVTHGKNLQDAKLNPATLTMPGAASTTVTGAAIDLQADSYKRGDFELELAMPALSTTIAPDTRTFTVLLETSATSNFTAVVQTQQYVYTGAGGAGIAAQNARFRIPSNAPQYARFKVTSGASTTDASALSATGSVRL